MRTEDPVVNMQLYYFLAIYSLKIAKEDYANHQRLQTLGFSKTFSTAPHSGGYLGVACLIVRELSCPSKKMGSNSDLCTGICENYTSLIPDRSPVLHVCVAIKSLNPYIS